MCVFFHTYFVHANMYSLYVLVSYPYEKIGFYHKYCWALLNFNIKNLQYKSLGTHKNLVFPMQPLNH
jgi:hypothetical protein